MKRQPFFAVRRNMVLGAIFYTFLWGSAFPLVKICMDSFQIEGTDNMSKCLLAGIRFTIAGILTLIFHRFFGTDGLKLDRKQLRYVTIYGLVATSMQYALTYIALSRMDGSKGAVWDQLGVFIIVLTGGLVFRDEKLGLYKLLGCAIGFIGVLAINTSSVGFSFSLAGEGVMLLVVVCQTLSFFLAKGSSSIMAASKMVGYGQLFGGVALTIVAFTFGGHITTVNPLAVVTLIGLAMISAVAYTLSLMPLKYFPVSEVSAFNLLITVFGVVMSAALLGDNIFRWNYLISLVLISFGILLINSTGKK